MKNTDNGFDRGVNVRTMVLGLVIGYLAGDRVNLPEGVAEAIGVVCGYVWDVLAFKIKSYFATAPKGE